MQGLPQVEGLGDDLAVADHDRGTRRAYLAQIPAASLARSERRTVPSSPRRMLGLDKHSDAGHGMSQSPGVNLIRRFVAAHVEAIEQERRRGTADKVREQMDDQMPYGPKAP